MSLADLFVVAIFVRIIWLVRKFLNFFYNLYMSIYLHKLKNKHSEIVSGVKRLTFESFFYALNFIIDQDSVL